MDDAAFVLISLRPAKGHDALRRAAARHRGKVLAISPWRIVAHDDAESRAGLAAALTCHTLVITSPNAVRAADALHPLRSIKGKHWLAVGEGSRRALAAVGIAEACAPKRMDSEGLLAMPQLADLAAGERVGLITAPGGRGEVMRQLTARSIDVVRADVYSRMPLPMTSSVIARIDESLRLASRPVLLALSSAEALAWLLAELPDERKEQLQHRVTVIAASARLAALAKQHDFNRVRLANSARPADLIAATFLDDR